MIEKWLLVFWGADCIRSFPIYNNIDDAEEIPNSVTLKLCVPLLCLIQYSSSGIYLII